MSGATTTPCAPVAEASEADSGAYTVLTGAAWVLRTVSGSGERDVYGAQCTTCRETSGQGAEVARSVGAWAIEHTRTHPNHRGYVSVVRTQWRVDEAAAPPGSGTALTETGSGQPRPSGSTGDEPRTGRTHHVRPLPSWRLVLAAAVWGRAVSFR